VHEEVEFAVFERAQGPEGSAAMAGEQVVVAQGRADLVAAARAEGGDAFVEERWGFHTT
jgi:hypothetical protein